MKMESVDLMKHRKATEISRISVKLGKRHGSDQASQELKAILSRRSWNSLDSLDTCRRHPSSRHRRAPLPNSLVLVQRQRQPFMAITVFIFLRFLLFTDATRRVEFDFPHYTVSLATVF